MKNMRPPALGSINCFVASPARIGRKRFMFDGTTKGLTLAALDNGATEGTIVQASFGFEFRAYRIERTPHDDRARGFWATEAATIVPTR